MSGRLLVFVGACFVLACAPTPRTQVMVSVEAEPGIARDAVRVHVRVRAGSETLFERVDQQVGGATEPVGFPVRIAVIPEANDASRRFGVEATAYDALDVPLGTVRALSSFVGGHTVGLRLLLEDCCRPLTCGVDLTCRGCECVPASVDPGTLPELFTDASIGAGRDAAAFDTGPRPDAQGIDAAASDAGPGPVDAGRDAGPPDAGRPACVGDIVMPAAGEVMVMGTLTAASPRWHRPAPVAGPSGCPATTLQSGAEMAAYRLYTLCNPNASPRVAVIDLRRGSLTDPYLAAYPGTTIAADARMCLAQNDDESGPTLDSRITITVPASGTVAVVATAIVSDMFGSYTLSVRPGP